MKLTKSFLCMRQFDKFWIWCSCNDRKRKSSKLSTCVENIVKSLHVNLFSAGFSHFEPLCAMALLWLRTLTGYFLAWYYVINYSYFIVFNWTTLQYRKSPCQKLRRAKGLHVRLKPKFKLFSHLIAQCFLVFCVYFFTYIKPANNLHYILYIVFIQKFWKKIRTLLLLDRGKSF